jgi:Lsr2
VFRVPPVGAGLSAYLLGVAVQWSGVGLSTLVRQRPVRGIKRPVAQKIQTLFIDDLDGSAAEGTIRFSLDGTEYEIDLNEEHAKALRDVLARYVGAARRASGSARRPARTGRRVPAGAPDTTEVREWAKAQGIEVKDRGRIPAELVVKFKAATTGQ